MRISVLTRIDVSYGLEVKSPSQPLLALLSLLQVELPFSSGRGCVVHVVSLRSACQVEALCWEARGPVSPVVPLR